MFDQSDILILLLSLTVASFIFIVGFIFPRGGRLYIQGIGVAFFIIMGCYVLMKPTILDLRFNDASRSITPYLEERYPESTWVLEKDESRSITRNIPIRETFEDDPDIQYRFLTRRGVVWVEGYRVISGNLDKKEIKQEDLWYQTNRYLVRF